MGALGSKHKLTIACPECGLVVKMNGTHRGSKNCREKQVENAHLAAGRHLVLGGVPKALFDAGVADIECIPGGYRKQPRYFTNVAVLEFCAVLNAPFRTSADAWGHSRFHKSNPLRLRAETIVALYRHWGLGKEQQDQLRALLALGGGAALRALVSGSVAPGGKRRTK